MGLKARSRQIVALIVVILLAAACRHSGTVHVAVSSPSARATAAASPSTSMPSRPAPTRSPAATASASATAPHRPSAQALLLRLQTSAMPASTLPSHLHVTGVGVWNYADAGHVGAGYLGSALVSMRSDVAGERVNGVYDVFDTEAAASVDFATAETNFRKFSSPDSFQELSLTPSAAAFCAPQAAPTNTTTCWLNHGNANGIVTVTIPSSADSGDGSAVIQAMLSHLVTEEG